MEPSGPSKSDSWSRNDSFWWGSRLRTGKIRLFHILAPGLWSHVSGLRSQVSSLRSQVSGLRSQVSGLRSQVLGLRSQVSGLRSQVSGPRSLVLGLRSQVLGCLWVSLGLLGCPWRGLWGPQAVSGAWVRQSRSSGFSAAPPPQPKKPIRS